jgi:hypothetical protein
MLLAVFALVTSTIVCLFFFTKKHRVILKGDYFDFSSNINSIMKQKLRDKKNMRVRVFKKYMMKKITIIRYYVSSGVCQKENMIILQTN